MIFDCGLLCAKSDAAYDKRNKIYNIDINMINSNLFAENLNVYMGGVAGEAKMTDISCVDVMLYDSSIGAAADDAGMLKSYMALSVGGILGYSAPGSDNVNLIGNTGNTLSECILNSYNRDKRYLLYAHENKGGAPNVGGLVGCTFNNITVTDSEVKAENGIISAIRRENNSSAAAYGPVAGGIIGRTEHTGRIYNTNVYGNNLTIEALGTEKNIYAGGITGIDVGAIHKAQATIEACGVYGNGSTEIIAESIFPEKYLGGTTYVGGITGYSGGKIEGCAVYDTELHTNTSMYITASGGKGYQNSIAGIAGFMGKASLTDTAVDFETGVFDCAVRNVKINVSGEYDDGIYCGGIAGRILGNVNVRNCSSECEIRINTLNGYTGGLIGAVINGNNSISRCRAKTKIVNTDTEPVSPSGNCGGVIGIMAGANVKAEEILSETNMYSNAKYKGIFIGYHQYNASSKAVNIVCITDNSEPMYKSNSALSKNVLNYVRLNTDALVLNYGEVKTVAAESLGNFTQCGTFEFVYDENVEQTDDYITVTAVCGGAGSLRVIDRNTKEVFFEKKIIVVPRETNIETEVTRNGKTYIFNIKYSGKPETGKLVTALYSGNTLAAVKYSECIEKVVLVSETEADKAKSFIWNYFNMMMPVSNVSVNELK